MERGGDSWGCRCVSPYSPIKVQEFPFCKQKSAPINLELQNCPSEKYTFKSASSPPTHPRAPPPILEPFLHCRLFEEVNKNHNVNMGKKKPKSFKFST